MRHDDSPSEGMSAVLLLVAILASLTIGYHMKADCGPCALPEGFDRGCWDDYAPVDCPAE